MDRLANVSLETDLEGYTLRSTRSSKQVGIMRNFSFVHFCIYKHLLFEYLTLYITSVIRM